MAVAAADIAPKAFQQLVKEGGEHQDVEDDLQVTYRRPTATLTDRVCRRVRRL